LGPLANLLDVETDREAWRAAVRILAIFFFLDKV